MASSAKLPERTFPHETIFEKGVNYIMKLSEIADKGDRLETLKTLRHKLAETIDESKSGRDISSLARQLQIVMAQIKELEDELKYAQDTTVLDIVRKKHSQRVRDPRGRRPSLDLSEEDDEE